MSRDPAFLFYDGDAARDVSHMNRLERGCYFDLIQAQRKFGKMSIETIKKVLGKEFDSCWDSVKMCLTYEEHMYFIEWVELSTVKRQEYSKSRSMNRTSKLSTGYPQKPVTYVEHMENEIENKKIGDIKGKEGCRLCQGSGILETQHNGKKRACSCVQ